MSQKPEEMTCRLSIGYMQSGRGPLGEHLPEQLVTTGKAWAKRAGIGQKGPHTGSTTGCWKCLLPLIRT
jgi:hypothetical protein